MPLMTADGIPARKGTYVLVLLSNRTQRLQIGRLGAFEMVPGYYAYVGSAWGAGGLKSRLGRHLETTEKPRWHIDYLRRIATPVEAWFTVAPVRLERSWAELFRDWSWFRPAIPRFGASEYHRARTTHLFHAKRRPSFDAFLARIRKTPHVDIDVQNIVLGKQG